MNQVGWAHLSLLFEYSAINEWGEVESLSLKAKDWTQPVQKGPLGGSEDKKG